MQQEDHTLISASICEDANCDNEFFPYFNEHDFEDLSWGTHLPH